MLEMGVPLYHFFAAGFEFPVVWKTLSDLRGSYHVGAELGNAVQVRPILRIAKSNLEAVRRGHSVRPILRIAKPNLEAVRRGHSVREWMRRKAFSIASSLSNPLTGVE